jgi:hypothetical protein
VGEADSSATQIPGGKVDSGGKLSRMYVCTEYIKSSSTTQVGR